jgi:hypothetical protein
MPEAFPADAPLPTDAAPTAGVTLLPYALSTRRRVWNWVRPGTAAFFLIVLAVAAGGMWGGWRWRLQKDQREFDASAVLWGNGVDVEFIHPPSRGALRHLARLSGRWELLLRWPASENQGAATAFGQVKLSNVTYIEIGSGPDADPLLASLSRPVGQWTGLASLVLTDTNVTDAGVKELARPDCGLKSLRWLSLWSTKVTDAGVNALALPDCGLKTLVELDLSNTQVTDASLKELSRPASGMKSLSQLDVLWTQVTDLGVSELKKAWPALKINY